MFGYPQTPLDGLSQSELQEGRRTLYRAKMSGALSVQYGDGSRVQYRTIAELDSALRDLDARLNGTAGIARPTRLYFATSKGL